MDVLSSSSLSRRTAAFRCGESARRIRDTFAAPTVAGGTLIGGDRCALGFLSAEDLYLERSWLGEAAIVAACDGGPWSGRAMASSPVGPVLW